MVLRVHGQRYALSGNHPRGADEAGGGGRRIEVRYSVFEGIYGKKAQEEAWTTIFAKFVEEIFLPWARDNKKSWRNDEDRGRVLCEYFEGKAFRDISPMLIEKYKRDRLKTKTKRGKCAQPQYHKQRTPAALAGFQHGDINTHVRALSTVDRQKFATDLPQRTNGGHEGRR